MASWKRRGVIYICPECGGAELKIVKDGQGKSAPADRVLYCPECSEAFMFTDLLLNWKSNQRPNVVPENYTYKESK